MISELALEQVRNGRYVGPLDGATHYGVVGSPGDGPWIEIWLEIRGDLIEQAAYRTHGCPSSQASAAMVCRLSGGRLKTDISLMTSSDLMLVLGGLPEGKGHFADMAVQALHRALTDGTTV